MPRGGKRPSSPTKGAERRSASLWNTHTTAPGWTDAETKELRLCLSVYGVGQWRHITEHNLLPNKTISQLCAQTRRLLLQHSTAELAGIPLDLDSVRASNAVRLEANPAPPTKRGILAGRVERSEEELQGFVLSRERVQLAERELAGIVAIRQVDAIEKCKVARSEIADAVWGEAIGGCRLVGKDGKLKMGLGDATENDYRDILEEALDVLARAVDLARGTGEAKAKVNAVGLASRGPYRKKKLRGSR